MRKFFVPEAVQTSGMDCGPAALKAIFEGFGIPVSYGRLREACQTGIDGTSIDTMEAVANQLGLQAEQVLLPPDHVLLKASKSLPAIAVVRTPGGVTHFVVVWSVSAGRVQIMDPAVGRRWMSADQFLAELYQHTLAVPAAMWREFACSDEFAGSLKRRLQDLRMSSALTEDLWEKASSAPGWQELALLDAGVRLTTALQKSKALGGRRGAQRFLERILHEPALIPAAYWAVTPGAEDTEGELQLLVRGAVLVRVSGKTSAIDEEALSEELTAALKERPVKPWRELQAIARQSGVVSIAVVIVALLSAAGAVLVESLLFRGLFDIASELGLAWQRIVAMTAILLFSAVLLLLDVSIFSGTVRLARQVELRFQVAFLSKIPKLGDRYFRSRLISDMAERSHTTHRMRHLPDLLRQLLRAFFELCFTAAGITWLEPAAAMIVCGAVGGALIPPFLAQALLSERDLRARSHAGALTRYYLDALLGLVAVRAHGAESSIRRGHERLLGEWASTVLHLQKAVVSAEAFQLVLTFGLVAFLLLHSRSTAVDIGRVLLLVYWALNLPVLGQEIGALVRQYPFYRNHTLRLLEPLGAPEEAGSNTSSMSPVKRGGPSIRFSGVSVQAGGHEILRDLHVSVAAGSHTAIVGQSGAGKSSLIGLLLGWLKPATGQVEVDGVPLDCEALRLETAWVDPTVQLWNQSLLANLCYGTQPDGTRVGEAVDSALLRGVLERLPNGMETTLGEGGALLSGGEGQRVRLARALLRDGVRLVILDEPFRGLDRETRHQLLRRAREHWAGCTLLCITHDLEETQDFDRVLVVENGTIVEDGTPGELLKNVQSRYAQMTAAEAETRALLWSSRDWRRIHVAAGHAVEERGEPRQDRRTGTKVA